jgi:hypothetical protein
VVTSHGGTVLQYALKEECSRGTGVVFFGATTEWVIWVTAEEATWEPNIEAAFLLGNGVNRILATVWAAVFFQDALNSRSEEGGGF